MTGSDISHPLSGGKVVGKPRHVWILAKDPNIRVWKSTTRLLCQAPPPTFLSHAHLTGNVALSLELVYSKVISMTAKRYLIAQKTSSTTFYIISF